MEGGKKNCCAYSDCIAGARAFSSAYIGAIEQVFMADTERLCMKKTKTITIVIVSTLSLVVVSIYPAYLNVVCGCDLDTLKKSGRVLFQILDREDDTGKKRWPVDGSTCPRTSVELIQSVAGTVAMGGTEITRTDIRDSRALLRLAAAWSVAKNVPSDAPDNLPVILSRNVDPASLTNHVTYENFVRPILLVKGYAERVDRMSAIVVYADGTVKEFGIKKGIKYSDVYRNKVLSIENELHLKYLTPTGEVPIGR